MKKKLDVTLQKKAQDPIKRKDYKRKGTRQDKIKTVTYPIHKRQDERTRTVRCGSLLKIIIEGDVEVCAVNRRPRAEYMA